MQVFIAPFTAFHPILHALLPPIPSAWPRMPTSAPSCWTLSFHFRPRHIALTKKQGSWDCSPLCSYLFLVSCFIVSSRCNIFFLERWQVDECAYQWLKNTMKSSKYLTTVSCTVTVLLLMFACICVCVCVCVHVCTFGPWTCVSLCQYSDLQKLHIFWGVHNGECWYFSICPL